jgi:hypothetical protein
VLVGRDAIQTRMSAAAVHLNSETGVVHHATPGGGNKVAGI